MPEPDESPAEREIPKRDRDKLARMRVAFGKIDALMLRLGLQGLQRMSGSSAVELQALQQTAHNAGLIHIERKLGALCTHVQRYLDKDPLFTMGDYLSTINALWLLCRRARRLHGAGKLPAEMIDVIGQARRSYELVARPLDLQPLGAAGWVSDTDFVGVTIYFYVDGQPDRLLQASNAKPARYFGTDPRRLMRMAISDHVDSSIYEMSHGAFRFQGAKVSPDGRLSLHKDLVVRSAPYIGGRAYEHLAVGSWRELLERLRRRQLDPLGAGAGPELVLIEPRSFGEVVIDDRQARCTAELVDAAGAPLQLEIPLRQENNFLIDNLEHMLGAKGRAAGLLPDALFGRAWTADRRLRFLPLTAVFTVAVHDRRAGHRLNEIHLALEDLKQVER